jgi:hypothetical protein
MNITYGALAEIDMTNIDANLAADLIGDTGTWMLYEAQSYKGDHVGDHMLQIVYCSGRAGIVLVGNGSSGATSWTDCNDPADALRRYINDDMCN